MSKSIRPASAEQTPLPALPKLPPSEKLNAYRRARRARRRAIARGETPAPLAALPKLPPSEAMKAYKRAWRARRRAIGKCTTCNSVPDVPGCVRCSACQAADNALYQKQGKARYQRRAKEVNGRAAEQRKQWERDGKCNWCGGPRDDLFAKRCAACSAYNKEHLRSRSAERGKRGLCRICGKPPESGKTCDACNAARRAEYRRTMATNPDKIRAKCHRRRARKLAAPGHFTANDFRAIKQAQGYRCLMCGRGEPEISLTVDHIIPLNKGGTNYRRNIQALCASCNKSKGDRIITRL